MHIDSNIYVLANHLIRNIRKSLAGLRSISGNHTITNVLGPFDVFTTEYHQEYPFPHPNILGKKWSGSRDYVQGNTIIQGEPTILPCIYMIQH